MDREPDLAVRATLAVKVALAIKAELVAKADLAVRAARKVKAVPAEKLERPPLVQVEVAQVVLILAV